MTPEKTNASEQTARQLFGYYLTNNYKEFIQIEYRYAANVGFDLFTRIQNRDYRFQSNKFFDALSMLLDQLPNTSSIIIQHKVLLSHKKTSTIVALEEWLFPFEVKGSGTVVYKLKLLINRSNIETKKHLDFGSAAEELRRQLAPHGQLSICYYCKYLVEYNEYGGTDYRHDQLYCFRDNAQTLNLLMKSYPKLSGCETLLSEGLPNVDSMHSCSAFVYSPVPRP